MTSMTNTDLGGEYGDKLIGHLKSDDFFGVETYPTATLEIVSSTPFQRRSSHGASQRHHQGPYRARFV